MVDIELFESENGGELRLVGDDLNLIEGVTNMPYLSCFGGADWWGNDLLQEGNGQQHTATTEETLRVTPLNSSGVAAIIRAVNNDLDYIQDNVPDTDIVVSATIPKPNRIDMNVNINGEEVYLLWTPNI